MGNERENRELDAAFADDVQAADIVGAVSKIDAVTRILEVVCKTTGLGFSAVARVTGTQWVACAVRDEIAFGLRPGGELKLESTICNEIRQHHRPVAIDHVANDPCFSAHPTPKLYGFQSYISVPIHLPDGRFFGTLCAIDPKPARVNTSEVISMFTLFADLIAMHLDAQTRVAQSEAALLDERQTSQLREQFIAVLGHDLRNPLAAIDSGVHVLRTFPQDVEAGEFLDILQRSAARMSSLISNVLDLARGRLGGGLGLHRVVENGLTATLEQVIAELQTAWPARAIQREISVDGPIYCERERIGQMLSNLLANALAHGDDRAAIAVRAAADASHFELSVTNRGETIPGAILAQLFHPFSRASVRPGQQGLGLGLYIAAEIARAHDGELTVSSIDGVTTFTFRMPLGGC